MWGSTLVFVLFTVLLNVLLLLLAEESTRENSLTKGNHLCKWCISLCPSLLRFNLEGENEVFLSPLQVPGLSWKCWEALPSHAGAFISVFPGTSSGGGGGWRAARRWRLTLQPWSWCRHEQSSSADWFAMGCPSHLCRIGGQGKDSDKKLRNP